jgi:SAM-dependent methyltransferase
MAIPFYHDVRKESLQAANVIVPIIFELVNPHSVIDVGCGSGSFLNLFKHLGTTKILGIDGPWSRKDLVHQFLNENEFKTVNLESEFREDERFDLAINLEVAEHLSEDTADIHVENLVSLSDIILFSAAIPYQGGQNHLNEQWPSYWAEKFRSYGYDFMDILRPVLWGRKEIKSWYQQNIFLVVKRGVTLNFATLEKYKDPNIVMDLVHPDIYLNKIQTINRVKNFNILYGIKYFIRKIKL